MSIVKPKVIIPIGSEVKKSLDNLNLDSNITITEAVTHPGAYAFLKEPEIDNFQKKLKETLLDYIKV